MNIRSSATTLLAAALVVAACSGAATPAPTAEPTPAPTTGPEPTPDACAKENLVLTTPGTLTIGADNPAFPPYFSDDPSDPDWEFGNPKNGKGFESAVAYAISAGLGLGPEEVTWIVVPFNNAIVPGDKPFDIYLTQVSYSAERATAVDLSDGYFDQNQTVVALGDNAISEVTTVAELAAYKLGAPVGTTSYQYIVDNIKPTQDPSVYDTLDAAIQAVSAKQIDAVVVDLPTAFFITAVQLDGGVIVGTLPTVGEVEHFSVVLDLGSPLTPCVNAAIAGIKADGTLAAITEEWITGQGAPALK